MNQSPGRGSPGSTVSSNTGSAAGSIGCDKYGLRHSVSSFDSGRASSTIYQQGAQSSGLSSESSSGNLRHSYHSSNSSLGSIAAEEICSFDVPSMVAHGIPDHEILNAWLTGMRFEFYYKNFIHAGYDMPTISRMTPEDLNAIGITKPHHRKRLKMEISQLKISDGLPNYIPDTLEDWLRLLNLEEYVTKLRDQGYQNVPQVTNITWEDLEETGVTKLGHQKKFMLAIKRIEDLMAGKRVLTGNQFSTYATPMNLFGAPPPSVADLPHHSVIRNGTGAPIFHQSGGSEKQETVDGIHHQRILQNEYGGVTGGMVNGSLGHQPYSHCISNVKLQDQAVVQLESQSDVVSIQLKNKNWANNRSPSEKKQTISSFLPIRNQNSTVSNVKEGDHHRYANFCCVESDSNVKDCNRMSNFCCLESDSTPTNESSQSVECSSSHVATLPRQSKKKHIPSAFRNDFVTFSDRCISSSRMKQFSQTTPQNNTADGYKSLPRDIEKISKTGYRGNFGVSESNITEYIPHGHLKMGPPPPPRRNCFVEKTNSLYLAEPDKPSNECSGNTNVAVFPNQHEFQLRSHEHPTHSSCSSESGTLSDDFSSQRHSNDMGSLRLKQEEANNSSLYDRPNVFVGSKYYNTCPNYATTNSSQSSVKPLDSTSHANEVLESDPKATGMFFMGVRRNGSDASFKSSSSAESESLPFANDNAGTIKQQKAGLRTHPLPSGPGTFSHTEPASSQITEDVFGDIGNMLADLTDELDAILEQELISKR